MIPNYSSKDDYEKYFALGVTSKLKFPNKISHEK
jgi:hypothetical protein